MGDIVHFNEAKADLSGDSRDWSPLDMLKALVRDIEEGKVKPCSGMCIHFWEDGSDEEGAGRVHTFFVSGMTFSEHLSLLTVAAHETIARYRGD